MAKETYWYCFANSSFLILHFYLRNLRCGSDCPNNYRKLPLLRYCFCGIREFQCGGFHGFLVNFRKFPRYYNLATGLGGKRRSEFAKRLFYAVD